MSGGFELLLALFCSQYPARLGNYQFSLLQMPVKADPAAWWRHVIGVVRDECHAVRQQQACLSQLVPRRRLRRQYQALYTASRTVSMLHAGR